MNKKILGLIILSFIFISGVSLLYFLNENTHKKDNVIITNTPVDENTYLIKKGAYKKIVEKYDKESIEEKNQETPQTEMNDNNKDEQSGNSVISEKIKKLKTDEKKALITAYLNYGTYSYQEKKYSKKAIALIETIPSYDSDYNIIANYAYAWEILKDYENALKLYNKALGMKKDNIKFDAYITRQIGHVYALIGDFNKSVEFYQKAYTMNSSDPYILMSLGGMYSRSGNYASGSIYYNEALSKTEDSFLKAEIYYNLSSLILYDGTQKNYQDKIKKSLDFSLLSIKQNSTYALGYLGAGRAYTELGEYKDAENNIKKGLEIYSSSYEGYKLLGILRYKEGKNKEAIEYFNKANILIKDDIGLMGYEKKYKIGETMFFLSLVYSKLKNSDNAIISITNILKSGNMEYITKMLYEISQENYGEYKDLKEDNKFIMLVTNLKNTILHS